MGDKTGIEWTDATWNPIRGCTRVSAGCRNCYAERVAARFSGPDEPYEGLARFVQLGGTPEREPRWTGKVSFVEEHLCDPLRWQKPRRIFVNSMSDLFHEQVQDEWIDKIFAIMAAAPHHVFQVLTKRPERMREKMNSLAKSIEPLERQAREMGYTFNFQRMPLLPWPIPNVWLGTSVEDQETANKRIQPLLQTPAAIHFVSYEPALGPIDFFKVPVDPFEKYPRDSKTNWVICGGESGPGARPMHPDWARTVRDQCLKTSTAFFFKQWGEYLPTGQETRGADGGPLVNVRDDGQPARIGKKKAGRLLDGREWNEYPKQESPAP